MLNTGFDVAPTLAGNRKGSSACINEAAAAAQDILAGGGGTVFHSLSAAIRGRGDEPSQSLRHRFKTLNTGACAVRHCTPSSVRCLMCDMMSELDKLGLDTVYLNDPWLSSSWPPHVNPPIVSNAWPDYMPGVVPMCVSTVDQRNGISVAACQTEVPSSDKDGPLTHPSCGKLADSDVPNLCS